ncbi:hypothetical protein V8E54_000848 [Elaphomyces granulatus]
MAAEDNISPSGPREYLESRKDVEEACLYESEEDTDEEWEFMDDDNSDALSGYLYFRWKEDADKALRGMMIANAHQKGYATNMCDGRKDAHRSSDRDSSR